MRRHRRAVVAVFALALTACGGNSGNGERAATAATGSAAGEGDALAALGIIAKDTSVRTTMARDFRDGNDGEALRQGDTIRTSVTGFAELAYFDGSFTRIDSAAVMAMATIASAAIVMTYGLLARISRTYV